MSAGEPYSEPCQTSKIESFAKIAARSRQLLSQNSPSQIFDRDWNIPISNIYFAQTRRITDFKY